jgi:hypothetical protein
MGEGKAGGAGPLTLHALIDKLKAIKDESVNYQGESCRQIYAGVPVRMAARFGCLMHGLRS